MFFFEKSHKTLRFPHKRPKYNIQYNTISSQILVYRNLEVKVQRVRGPHIYNYLFCKKWQWLKYVLDQFCIKLSNLKLSVCISKTSYDKCFLLFFLNSSLTFFTTWHEYFIGKSLQVYYKESLSFALLFFIDITPLPFHLYSEELV